MLDKLSTSSAQDLSPLMIGQAGSNVTHSRCKERRITRAQDPFVRLDEPFRHFLSVWWCGVMYARGAVAPCCRVL